jgi:hypothetical protein
MNSLNDFITLHLDLVNLKIKEEIEKNINIVPNTNITTIKLFNVSGF